jgi:hypothetical protein
MLRPAVGARERDPFADPADARQAAAIIIVGASIAAMGVAVVLRLKQLQSD